MPLDATTYPAFQEAWWSGKHWSEVQVRNLEGEMIVFRGTVSAAHQQLAPYDPGAGNPTAARFQEHLQSVSLARSFFVHWHSKGRQFRRQLDRPAPAPPEVTSRYQTMHAEENQQPAPQVDARLSTFSCGLRAVCAVSQHQLNYCDNHPLCDTWDRLDGCCACPPPFKPTPAESQRIAGQSIRCPSQSLLPSLLLLGTAVETVELADRTTDSVLLAAMPRPQVVAQGTKRKRTHNKIGERNSDPKHLNDPERVRLLQQLEAETKQQRQAKENKKEEKADYQAPVIPVMIHTGWLKKGANLTGALLDQFFKANYNPVNGPFKSKPPTEGTKPPTVKAKTRFIGGLIKKFKEDNPTLDPCTAIPWKCRG